MPAPNLRGDHLLPEDRFEELQERERAERVRRFAVSAGQVARGQIGPRREFLDTTGEAYREPEDFEPRFHDHHSLAEARSALAEALNSR